MTKQPSRSDRLIAAMHREALTALAASPTGQLPKAEILNAIELNVVLDDWAIEVYENGNTRWRSIFSFASVWLLKAGYVTKAGGVWSITPEVRMAAIQGQANEALAAGLLEKIKAESPAFFERLVVQLLVAMGYGGNQANPGQVTQLSADNDIDGIINEDKLGLDTIYLQAKRWQDPVGEGPVR